MSRANDVKQVRRAHRKARLEEVKAEVAAGVKSADRMKIGTRPTAAGKKRGGVKGAPSPNPHGRPKGGKNRNTLAREFMLNYKGLTPLEYMLQVLTAPEGTVATFERRWAAEKAIPYTHRKMPVAVEVTDTSVEPAPIKVVIERVDARKKED